MISASSCFGVSGGQPASLVISPGRTGTSVHWSGLHLFDELHQIGARVSFDVVFHAARE